MNLPPTRGVSRLATALLGVPSARWSSLVPGFLIACALAVFAKSMSGVVGTHVLGFEKSPISPVMISIVLGMVIGNLGRLPTWTRPGLRFSVTKVLRLGIILLGIRLSVVEVARLGAASLPIVLVCILFGLAFTALLTRWFSLPPRLGALIGVGTSICGVSAIVATGPAIGARDEETSYAVAVITVFGLLAMVAYPFLCPFLFASDPTSIGLFLGTAIHDTSQVNGAGLIYADGHDAPRALDVAVVTKLVRNLFMIAVIPLVALRHRRAHPGAVEDKSRFRVTEAVPAFVIGFVLLAAFRSLGDAGAARGGALGLWDDATWMSLCRTVQSTSVWCLVVALSAVGLSTDFRAMRSLSLAPFLVGLGAALAVGAISFAAVSIVR